MEDANIEVVKGAYEAFGRGDVEAVLGTFSEDVQWHEAEGMPYGGVYTGREAIAQDVFGPITQDIPNFSVTPEEYIASGDTVVAVVRYRGTGQVTGKELDLPVVHVWDVRDGQLARFRQFADTVKFGEVVPATATVSA